MFSHAPSFQDVVGQALPPHQGEEQGGKSWRLICVQVDLGAQVEVEEGVEAQHHEEHGRHQQEGVLRPRERRHVNLKGALHCVQPTRLGLSGSLC